MAKATVMTPAQYLYPAVHRNVRNFLYDSGYLFENKIKSQTINKYLKNNIGFYDIEVYIFAKNLLHGLAKAINNKRQCRICYKILSSLLYDGKGLYKKRNCVSCTNTAIELKELRQREASRKRKVLLKTISDNTINAKELKSMLEVQKYKCVICNASISESKHLDHIKPVSKGGLHSIKNVQWLCPPCNMHKHNKWEEQYA